MYNDYIGEVKEVQVCRLGLWQLQVKEIMATLLDMSKDNLRVQGDEGVT